MDSPVPPDADPVGAPGPGPSNCPLKCHCPGPAASAADCSCIGNLLFGGRANGPEFRLDFGVSGDRLRTALQLAGQLGAVELVFPACDDKGGNAVADCIGQGPALAHESVDP